MIYTMTFNPALDYIVQVPDYREGAVNRTAAEKIMAGGKGVNVSIVLHNLGVETTALGFVAGFTGGEIERLLKARGVRTDFIRLPDGISRINVKLKAGRETEVNGLGPAMDETALRSLYQRLDRLSGGDYLVLAGSIPASLPDSIYCDIMKRLEDRHLRVVVDAEKDLLENVLPYHPFLIKPNHHELGALFGKELTSAEEVAEHARLLQERGARNVLVSMAGAGGVLAAESGEVLCSPAPEGRVVNSTGAGDSMVAGFLAGYLESGDCEKAFVMGLCAGSASAFSEELATRTEIEALYRMNRKNKVKNIL